MYVAQVTTCLERERLVLLELNQQDRLLIMLRHELVLRIPGGEAAVEEGGGSGLFITNNKPYKLKNSNAQPATIEARHQIRYAFPLDTHVLGQDIAPHEQGRRYNFQV